MHCRESCKKITKVTKVVASALKIYKDALALEKAGIFALVLEGIPIELAELITQKLNIPTIGIGASKYCDGQILVTDDIIGLSSFSPRFVKKYSNIKKVIEKSVKKYCDDVKNKRFPSSKNVYKNFRKSI